MTKLFEIRTHRCTVLEDNSRHLWVGLFIKGRKRALWARSFTL
jgi:hypothetical protein